MRPFLLFTLALAFAACSEAPAEETNAVPARTAALQTIGPSASPDEFGDYWYQGLAEITTYDLEQARYGALHDGEAVLIYVTEPFSRQRQVKLDRAGVSEDEVTVLKLNATRQFTTGVYPYSMMTSVFTPISEGPYPLKVTTSSQEWCGHTFTQMNRDAQGYDLSFFSYFEGEGDQRRALADAIPEDGLWTLLRLNPDALPTGEVTLLPGTIHQRFSHRDLAAEQATAGLSQPADGLRTYTIEYPDLGRTLAITFTADFPHTIERWTETEEAGGNALTTTATRRERQMLDYWARNSPADEALRTDLGLE